MPKKLLKKVMPISMEKVELSLTKRSPSARSCAALLPRRVSMGGTLMVNMTSAMVKNPAAPRKKAVWVSRTATTIPGHRGRGDAGSLPDGGVEGDRAHHRPALYQVGVERLPGGLIECADAADEECNGDQVPRLHHVEEREHGEQEDEGGVRDFGDDYHRPLVEPVGEHAAEEVEQDGGS